MRLKAGDSDLYYYTKIIDTTKGSGTMTQIMLIGRDRATADEIMEHLEMHQLKVTPETSAEAALAALKQDAVYAAMIVDGELPGIDMERFIGKVRKISRIPVVMLTGTENEAEMIRGFESGADLCCAKTLPAGIFAAQILALIRLQERVQSEEVRKDGLPEIRGIRLDPVRRRVRVRGKEKKFTRKEFDLLYFLMTHPEEVFTKEDLYREVWNEEAVGGMATVVMHIKKIRNIIEERPAQPTIIKTEWGVGYYFTKNEPE